ncbi:MAG: ArsA family ATPase [Okeania sp. SIO3I5]|nr:ArsA family ATPase [Okeania sp. SIO3I5]
MTITYTFLGKGGTGKTTIAFATAKRYASQGKRVLFVGQEPAMYWKCQNCFPSGNYL